MNPSSMSNSESNQDNRSASRIAESAPRTISERNRWVCWRYEKGGEKKVPYDPETDERASIRESETWSDIQTALDCFERQDYDGVGFVLTEDDSLTGIDFDDCRDPETGEIASEVESIIDRLDSYTEISPSGTGFHTLVNGPKSSEYGSKGGQYIEVYDSARYFTVTGDHLDGTPESIESREDELQRICKTYLNKTSSAEAQKANTPDIDADDDLIEMGENALHELQEESTPTFRAVMDFLQGGIADFDRHRLIDEDGLIDRSGQEQVGISLLYCTLRRYLDESEQTLRDATWATWTHYCREHPTTAHSQKRRWLEDTEDYRERTFTYGLATADDEKFEMMVQKKGAGTRRENNEYSEMTYGALWDALSELTPTIEEVENLLTSSPPLSNDMDPGNPERAGRETDGHIAREAPEVHELYAGKSEVIDRGYEIDNEYNKWGSYEEAFRRLQATFGEVKAARIGSSTWVFYPSHYPDPPEASYIKQYGEKYDPEVADEINSWTGEPEPSEASDSEEILPDGGTRMETSEAKRDIKRVQQVREENTKPTEEAELYRCPIEGCSRTVIGEPSSLRSHVRQTGDDAHRFRTLNEDLDLEFDEEAYHATWGPGAQEQAPSEPESIYEPDDPWGPGLPAVK